MTRPSVDALLENAGWIRALSLGLVRDPDVADDVVQDTWLAALATGPARPGALRGWLRTVATNFARQALRRRARSEAPLGFPEEVPDERVAVLRAEYRRRLVEAVMELSEPYRTTIILRFFEELSPDRIARIQGVPPSTVRTRVQRALRKLRARLDGAYGGRSQWTLVVGSLARVPSAGGTAWLTFGTGTKVAVLVFLAVAGSMLLRDGRLTHPGSPEPGARDELARSAGPPSRSTPVKRALAAPPAPEEPPGAARAPGTSTSAERAQVEVGQATLEVELVSESTGERLPAIRLVLELADERGPREQAVTDEDGMARFHVPAKRPLVLSVLATQAGGEDRSHDLPGLAADEVRTRVLEIAAPRLARFHGAVVDGRTGSPLAGVRVVVQGRRYKPTLGCWALAETPDRFGRTETDASGCFDLPHASTLVGTTLELRSPGYAPTTAGATRGHASADTPLVVELFPAATLVARLVDDDATPRAGFALAIESDSTGETHRWESEAGPDGSYLFQDLPAGPALYPRAAGGGLTRAFAPLRLEPGEYRELTLAVDRGCTLSGTLLDREGEPVPLAKVTISTADRPREPVFELASDDRGRFSLPSVGAGSWVVQATGFMRMVGGELEFLRSGSTLVGTDRFTIAPEDRSRDVVLTLGQSDEVDPAR